MEIFYLACPYTHPDPLVMEARFRAATLVSGRLFERGIANFSPITHSHPVKMAVGLRDEFAAWMEYDFAMIEKVCNGGLLVLRIDGWSQSTGVFQEVQFAKRRKIPVKFLDPKEFGLQFLYPYLLATENLPCT